MLILLSPEALLVRDLGGPYPSVTNDAENVVADLHGEGILDGQRVMYIDSWGHVDEVVHSRGVFIRFAPGPWSRLGNWCFG